MSSEPPTGLGQALCEAVDASFESEQVGWFRRLVNQPSHTAAPANVEKAAGIIDDLAADLGLRREVLADPEGRYAAHRVHSTPATGDGDKAVTLVGHVDTVFPESMGFLEFRRDAADSESKGDIVRGPGVLDMKSGLSSILFALRAVKAVAPDRFAQLKLRFVCNSDEEVGSPSSRALFEHLAPRTTVALVFEGGRHADRIITARKGGGSFRFTVKGKAAHAGNEHKLGINAIHGLALLIPRIEALTDYERGITVNVGLVAGGTAKNTVPEEAWCQVDTRFVTQDGAEDIVSGLESLASDAFQGMGEVPLRLEGARCELSGRITRPPMEPDQASQRLRGVYEGYAAAQGLQTGEAPLQGGGSDANLLSAFGVPSIDGLGPYGKAFHSVDEWSSLDSLRRRTRALACLLAETESGQVAGQVGETR